MPAFFWKDTAIVQQRHGAVPLSTPKTGRRVAPINSTDQEAWAALAPLIAGQPRVRVSRDTGKNYPQKFERDLAPARPTQPAAVLIYGRDGSCATICLDFDSSVPGGEARVAADVLSVQGLLFDAGLRWIEDQSPNGGRHLYVPLATRMPFHQARAIVEALAGKHPSLDPTPHQNLRHGCIRTPGSTHKSGGTQRLEMSLSMATEIATQRNPDSAVDAFIKTLQPEIQAAVARREEVVDSPAPSATQTGTLSRRVALIATQGIYDTARYSSPSEARMAVLVAAASHGMQLTDVERRMKQGAWPGLAQFYARYSPTQRFNALHRDWVKACKFASQSALKSTVHKTNTSELSSQGVGPSGSFSHEETEHRFIRSWRNALSIAEHRYKSDRAGLAKRLVLRALGAGAHMVGSRVVEFGVRSLSIASGVEPTTVAAHLRALRSETDPLIRHVGEANGTNGDQYELVIPAYLMEQVSTQRWQAGKLHSLRPVFRELGAPAAFVYEALERLGGTPPVNDLVLATGLSRSSVHESLEILASWALAERTSNGWRLIPETNLQSLAESLGILEIIFKQVTKFREQRAQWRAWLAERVTRLPQLLSPDDDYPFELFGGPPDDWSLGDMAFRTAS